MAIQIEPNVLKDLKAYGAGDVSACFHCGNCTAVCPLSENGGSFPRRMIRLGQIGAKRELLASAEPWLCYGCGECAQTCPREAEPAEYMASLRRYQIAHLDPTGLGRLWFKVPAFALILSLALLGVLGAFLLTVKGSRLFPQWLFGNTVAYETIHTVGMVVGGVLLALLLGSFATLVRKSGLVPLLKGRNLLGALAWLGGELVTMKRHGECEAQSAIPVPRRKNPRVVHWAIMWGFIALGVATALDFLFIYFMGWTIVWPARVLGTVGGLVMLLGVSGAILRRLTDPKAGTRRTRFADAWVLFFLWVLAVTGFWLEIVVTLRTSGLVHDWVLVIHAAMAMELVLLFGMTKMAHVLYRPFMLLKHRLEQTAPMAETAASPSVP
ncbi:MAG: 4Fe-4S dicluster domain-containing protein [Spirochaetes bacterium]|nr:4Fe-4S dicluster domain-containing protein [Spirochaetota bacterium]